jgi:hypothetical protein
MYNLFYRNMIELVNILKGFALVNPKIAEKAIIAISNLAHNNRENSQRLGNAGVPSG